MKYNRIGKCKKVDGSLVKRSRRRPLTAETGVRFPYELRLFMKRPNLKIPKPSFLVGFGIFYFLVFVKNLKMFLCSGYESKRTDLKKRMVFWLCLWFGNGLCGRNPMVCHQRGAAGDSVWGRLAEASVSFKNLEVMRTKINEIRKERISEIG